MISLKSIEEAHSGVAKCRINKLVYPQNRGSLVRALLRSMKSTYTFHFPNFFLTTTMLANHLG